ncbi:F0F1 ATP synthase subunit epsilon [candidate division FCPU426 bacterium]|nr:F0F1 ATP synthase subunit epsilon [candidate division FCPU426 bacterium]
MRKNLTLEIVTPQRHILSQEVEEVVCPGAEGSFGVLPGHIPMVSALKPGMLKYRQEEEEVIYAIGGGYAEIGPTSVIVLADTAERADEIDIEAARREKERALAQMKRGIRNVEMEGVEVSLKKALARLSVADAVRRRKSG